MKSLLILTPRFPYPVIGGDRLRIYQVCKVLSKTYRLTLLSLCETKEELAMPIPSDGVFSSVERVYLPRWRSLINCLFTLPSSVPLQVAYYFSKEFSKRAVKLMETHDGVLAHLIRTAYAVENARGFKFLEMTDAISLNYRRVIEAKSSTHDIRNAIYKVEASRVRRYEELVVDKFDMSFLVSDIDKAFLFSESPEKAQKVKVCSNGVDLSCLNYHFNKDSGDIIFIGNMASLQNYDAAFFMASEILPLVNKRFPHVRLRLIGRIPQDKKLELEKFINVDVTGEVHIISLAAKGGAVGVCPLRLGAGVQNKVLEYMALGLPVVTTTLGFEGFAAVPGKDLIVQDDVILFANAIVDIIANRDDSEKMAINARKYVEREHSWDSILSPMCQVIDTTIKSKVDKILT